MKITISGWSIRGAGFREVRTEEVALRFKVADVDDYLSVIADTAGPLGLALRALQEADRAAVKNDVQDAFGRFAAQDGYQLPGIALCAVAS